MSTLNLTEHVELNGVCVMHHASADDMTHIVVATEGGKPYQGRDYKGRRRTFKGESAWSDAQRLFGDIVTEVRYTRK